MPSFAVSISVLGLIQGALVALPGRLPPLPWGLGDLRSRWWALLPAGSIGVVILVVNFYADSATFLTYLALAGVPPLAAIALGGLVRGSRPAWAFAAAPLFVLAWAAVDTLGGEAAATALSALACISLGWLLVSVVPAPWLRWGVYAMAAVDTWLVATDLLQGPNSVLTAAAPVANLPRLQAVHLGSAAMGFGDLFVAGLVGCLLVTDRRRQLACALLVAVLALLFDLLFFTVDTLPATVPVAVALALTQRFSGGPRPRTSRSPLPPRRAGPRA
jgi:hypothetical protein